MKGMALVGGQWGDEGKGKVIDVISRDFDVVVRYQGGENAGHTVKIGDKSYFFHILPTGALREDKICVIGNGVVINPETLIREIKTIEETGMSIRDRLYISSRAHLVFPYHKEIDRLRDTSRIGTTCKGIGPAYEDKMGRRGIRALALTNEDFLRERIEENLTAVNRIFTGYLNREIMNSDELFDSFKIYAYEIGSCVRDTAKFLNTTDKKILYEGAQGVLLDIDHGTYPFVTSSNSSALGISAGSGVSPLKIGRIIGLFKAYCTRVGEGPFPSELNDETGKLLREKGCEFGTTTGRPRRCGWFDSVAGRYSSMINGYSVAAITKLDVMDSFEEISVCESYKYKGSIINDFPAEPWILDKCTPVLRKFKGWRKDLSGVREYADLPVETTDYLKYLEEVLQCPAGIISVGPERDQTVIHDLDLGN